MSESREERNMILELARNCMDKLELNRYKAHWMHVSNPMLFHLMNKEIDELKLSLKPGHSISDVWKEAADIANFAAMIASKNEIEVLRGTKHEDNRKILIDVNDVGNYRWSEYCIKKGRINIAVIYDMPEEIAVDATHVSNFGESMSFDTAQTALKQIAVNLYHSDTGGPFIIATHNTALISNDILRPDCYFTWSTTEKRPIPFFRKTSKEIKFQHNLEKMFRAGTFR